MSPIAIFQLTKLKPGV